MAAITPTLKGSPRLDRGSVLAYYGTSTANQADTLTTPVVPEGGSWRLLYAACNYSGSPTQTGVTVEIDSQAGAAYDVLLQLHVANGRFNTFVGDPELWMVAGDAIRVSAPAGGGTLTAAVLVVLETR